MTAGSRVRKILGTVTAAAASLAPLCALGHGTEFLTAKLTLLPEAQVQIEITADYANNPLVPDEAAALAALANPLQVKVGEAWVALNTLVPPVLRHHQDWAGTAPPNLLPPPDDPSAHALLTATWRWTQPEDNLVFTVPKGNMNDVFLWQEEAAPPPAAPKWMLLLGGDVTRPLAVIPRTNPGAGQGGWAACLSVVPVLGLAILGWRWRRGHTGRKPA